MKRSRRVLVEGSGQRNPELTTFYDAVTASLGAAEEVLLFGAGTAASRAIGQLLSELRNRHPQLAGRVIGSVVIGERHLTEDQLLAKAREAFTAAVTARAAAVFPRRGWSEAD
jgi:hypothetical protein